MANADLRELTQAAASGDLGRVRQLVERGAEIKALGRPAQAAAGSGQPRVVEYLLAKGADVDRLKLLHAAIRPGVHEVVEKPRPGNREVVELLIEHGASLTERGGWPSVPPLVLAAMAGSRELVDLLFAKGAKVDLYAASVLGLTAKVGKMLDTHPAWVNQPDASGLSPLHFAASSHLPSFESKTGRALAKTAELLVDRGADVNQGARVDDHLLPPSYWACSAHNEPVLRVLLERGARASEALGSALWNGTFAIAETLLAAGADIDYAGDHGPVLFDLAHWGQFQKAEWLLARGANPDCRGPDGRTPLHAAAARGARRFAERLIAAGADVNARDRNRRTPLRLALEKRKLGMQALLESAGGSL